MPGPEDWTTPAAVRPDSGAAEDPARPAQPPPDAGDAGDAGSAGRAGSAGDTKVAEVAVLAEEAGQASDPGGPGGPGGLGGTGAGGAGGTGAGGRDGASGAGGAGAAGEEAAERPRLDRAALLGGDVPFRPLAISEMLDGAIAGIRRNPRAILGLSLALNAGIQVCNSVAAYFFIGGAARDEFTPGPVMRSVGTQFTLGLIALVMSAYGTLLLAGLFGPVLGRMLFGLPTSMRESWRDARPQVLRLVVVAALVLTLSVLGAVLPIVPFFLTLALGAHPGLAVLAGLLGFPLSLVLMMWLYVLLVLAVPAVVMERQGVIDALRRARQLSRGRWWRTCGTLLLTLLITIIMGFFALRIPFVLVELIAFGDDPSGAALVGALSVDTLGRIVSWSLIGTFDAGVIVLLYIDRRMRREGFDLELQTHASGGRDRLPADFLELWRPSDLVPPPGTPPAPSPPPPPYRPFMAPGQPGAAPPGHPPPGHPQAGYPQPGYPQAGYPQPGYPPPGYPQPGYPQPGHPQAGYPQAGYPQAGYPPPGHPQAGHPRPGPPPPSHPPGYPPQGPPHAQPRQGGWG